MSRSRLAVSFVALLALVVSAPLASANNWPSWRGPTFNGVAPKGNYPVKWSATENVAWKLKLPGKGTSTPIVWGDQIILTCQDGGNTTQALDRNGKVIWKTTIGEKTIPGKHRKASGSNPSPVTDGRNIYVYFKTGDLACLTLAGKLVWQTNLQKAWGKDTLWWDLGTSPVLSRDKVIVAVMQTGGSYVVAFSKKDGHVDWKTDRNLEAPLEAAQSYTTPLVLNRDGQERLLVLGADHVTAQDVANGKELWRVGGLNPGGQKYFRSISSPVVAGDLLLAPYSRGSTLTAIRLGGEGDVTGTHVAWINKGGAAADVPTPIVQGKRAFVCSDRGKVTCLDVKSGKTIWSGQPERNRQAFSSSPVLAGGKIYITREDGKTFVIGTGDKFEVLGANTLGEFTVATPIFSRGQLLLRTTEHLYCIGKSKTAAAATGE